MKILCVMASSHAWFWVQTAVSSLLKVKHGLEGVADVRFVIVDNSWVWSPSFRGISETELGDHVRVFNNM